MTKMEEKINSLREKLKGLVTADNTDAVAKCSQEIDDLEAQSKSLEEENLSLKDKIVDMVKGNISFKEPPKDENKDDEPKSIDDAINDSLKDIYASRK